MYTASCAWPGNPHMVFHYGITTWNAMACMHGFTLQNYMRKGKLPDVKCCSNSKQICALATLSTSIHGIPQYSIIELYREYCMWMDAGVYCLEGILVNSVGWIGIHRTQNSF